MFTPLASLRILGRHSAFMTKRWKAGTDNDLSLYLTLHTLFSPASCPSFSSSCAKCYSDPPPVRRISHLEFTVLMRCCSTLLGYVRPKHYCLISSRKNLELLRLIDIPKYIVLFHDWDRVMIFCVSVCLHVSYCPSPCLRSWLCTCLNYNCKSPCILFSFPNEASRASEGGNHFCTSVGVLH